ncbi:non-ribosomal peptide synthetase [Tumebacillus algifaecis]|uniref:non-ribosomal peptide synthetase n=1 Tax=Tumebacillus algifaecis TaxID=1214604 RepID=UPI0015610C67|nr:non-ribosomal peptide synthetase [Tumebacillus algifaecis]
MQLIADQHWELRTLNLQGLPDNQQEARLREAIDEIGTQQKSLQAILCTLGKEEHLLCLLVPIDAYEDLQDLLLAVAAGYEQELAGAGSTAMTAAWKASLDGPWLSEAEREKVLFTWNETGTAYPREQSIQELFEEQATRTPDAVAVVDAGEQLTYRQLNERANRVAQALCVPGVGPDVLVAICVERSVEMIVGMLGILKAGGAYVPLDPAYPKERLAYMLSDTETTVLLTQRQIAQVFPAHDAVVLCLEDLAGQVAENPPCRATAESLAYVMYTSGSTGRPKGVAVPQRGVVRLVRDTNYLQFGPQEVFLQAAAVSFDAATLEIWGALLNGARVVLMPSGALSLEELGRVVREQAVTVLWLTAGLFHQMVEHRLPDLRGVRYLLAGGDVLSVPHVQKVLRELDGIVLLNGYGPTENTTFTCCYPMRKAEDVGTSVPIGRPISNTTVYLLDKRMQPVPVGVPGELYTGGDGLARGYWRNEQLTADAFVAHPFVPSDRLYKTGDLARYLPDGQIEFLGRIDSQVKIRGFRIETGEIETAMFQHPAVRSCAIFAREDVPGVKRLVAYVVLSGQEQVSIAEWRAFLAERLPEYMIPAVFVQIDALPLTANGKVDKKALPAPTAGRPELRADYVAPRVETEVLIARIWGQMLGIAEIGIYDDFYELGGDSLLATQILSRVRAALGVELSLADVLEAQTVARLAETVTRSQTADSARLHSAGDEPNVSNGSEIGSATGQNAGRSANAEHSVEGRTELPNRELRPIPHRAGEALAPVSFAQQRLWFLDRLEPGSALYNLPLALRLRGELNVTALEQALSEVVRRHEALRTVFVDLAGQAMQVVAAAKSVELRKCVTWDDLRNEAAEPFDLERGPLIRAQLLRVAEADHVLLLNMHHIVSDGWSLEVLRREFAALYTAFVEGQASPLPELPVQYGDYASWHREWLEADVLDKQLVYWKEQLSGELPVLQLPADRQRPAVQSFRGGTKRMMLSADLVRSLQSLSQSVGATLYMTMLSAFKTLLHRYTALEDVLVGTPISGRNRAETEGLIGFFVNTLVLRTEVVGTLPFRDLIARVRQTALGAFANQDVPFEKLVEALRPERDGSHSPFFQVMFVFENSPKLALELPGLTLEPAEIDNGMAKFDLSLLLMQEAEGLSATFEYSLDLFEESTVERMMGHFVTLLQSVCAAPERTVAQLSLLTAEELTWQHTLAASTNRDFDDTDLRLHELFERQVATTPHAVALVAGQTVLTYRELNDRANRTARYLLQVRTAPIGIVAVCMERSVEMVVALLAVLKAGGAYLPLDPEYPQERLAFMLEDSRASILLTQSRLQKRFDKVDAQVLALEEIEDATSLDTDEASQVAVAAQDAAYVIYTSGSTGTPKGVVVPHGAICNHMLWMQEEFPLDATDAVLQKTSFSFDASVWEFYAPLFAGGRLVLAEPGGHLDARYLIRVMQEHNVTVLQVVPSMLTMLLGEAEFAACGALKRVFCGGEALSAELVKRFYALLPAELVNLYGPTEACIDATFHVCSRDTSELVPIGRPVANVQTLVLDEAQQLVPVGVTGELYIGGAGLALGYLHRPDLTAEKFVETSFGRLYKTGDLARQLADGTLQYAGRIDHQVKLRGFRIELGEIEVELLKHPAVTDAVVMVQENRLIGYVVACEAVERSALQTHLRARLPDYMVPAQMIVLEAFPLTANGKVDRKALPKPDIEAMSEVIVLPRGAVEEVIAVIWADLLEVEQVGVTSNFFALGGHSLLAMQVISQICEALDVELGVKALFDAPTVEGLTGVLLQNEQERQRIEKTAELLLQLSDMSELEVQMMMEAEK